MATRYAKHVSTKQTSQSSSIPGRTQVQNSASGFVFQIDEFARLDRFLILGCSDGTYYADEKTLTIENASCVEACVKKDGKRTVERIVEVSDKGLAAKNDPAIFALALCSAHGDQETKRLAHDAIPKVCRIGTHLFQFVAACKQVRGWGSGLKRGIRQWYERTDLAYQLVKYQQRDGWSHRDVLRLCHPKMGNHADVRWALWLDTPPRDVLRLRPNVTAGGVALPDGVKGKIKKEQIRTDHYEATDKWFSPIIDAFETLKAEALLDDEKITKQRIIRMIELHNLPRECIPTKFLNKAEVWEALLQRMPMTAMIRNLATMTRVGLLSPLSDACKKVRDELDNPERLRKSRIHPVQVLSALLTYKAGRSLKSDKTWTPVGQIVDSLDAAFYKAFGNVEPTGLRWFLGLDVSGSMSSGDLCGVMGLSPRVGSCAMALVTAAVEDQHFFACFHTGMFPFDVSPKQRLDDVCHKTACLPWGGTDCAQPMIYAMEHDMPVDVFVIYTDNETWAGGIHPCQALQQYRQKMGIPAKLIVVAMTATGFSIADPNDAGMLDVCGFSTDVPQMMSQFANG